MVKIVLTILLATLAAMPALADDAAALRQELLNKNAATPLDTPAAVKAKIATYNHYLYGDQAKSINPAEGNAYDGKPAPKTMEYPLSGDDWDRIFDNMRNDYAANDQTGWIALTPDLASLSLGNGEIENLSNALAMALPEQPEAVLKVLSIKAGRPNSVQAVCSLPFEQSAKEKRENIKIALSALAAVSRPDLRQATAAYTARLRTQKP